MFKNEELNVVLKLISENELEWARKLRNKNRFYFVDNNIINKEQQIKWFKGLGTKRHNFYIIWVNSKKAGTISIKKKGKYLIIGNVIIDNPYRRKGILNKVINIITLRKENKSLMLEVLLTNTYAIKAYEKVGFHPESLKMIKTL